MICHHYQCVFIHIPKTAGQSIEHVFLNLLDLTWATRAPLLLRRNNHPELGPPHLAHLKAPEYVLKKYMTPAQFNSYFKFSFVRNPWARVVSMYRSLGYQGKCEFKQFLSGAFKKKLWRSRYWFVGPQYEFLYDENGTPLVDFVGRFENLQKDFDHACRQLGIPETVLPHANNSDNKKIKFGLKPRQLAKYWSQRLRLRNKRGSKRKDYVEYYDDESRAMVADWYKKDIELFGYQFGHEHSLNLRTS